MIGSEGESSFPGSLLPVLRKCSVSGAGGPSLFRRELQKSFTDYGVVLNDTQLDCPNEKGL